LNHRGHRSASRPTEGTTIDCHFLCLLSILCGK